MTATAPATALPTTATEFLGTKPVLFFVDDLAEGVPAAETAFHEVDPDRPQIAITDLGPTRGDGVFETASVVNGHVQAFENHLRRFAKSAALLGLPAPRLDVWRAAIEAAVAAHAPVTQASAKVIMTRGLEGVEVPTGWVYVTEVDPATVVGPRTEGIRVLVLDRGYRHDIAQTAPWLLQGAKTLSYGLNQATLRWAVDHGADDAIFTTTDGFVLEGPHASLVLKKGDTIVTPATDQGILEGTTQSSTFDFFEREGLTTEYRQVATSELAEADALWLVSSVRMATPIVSLDGVARTTDPDLTARLNAFLLSRTE